MKYTIENNTGYKISDIIIELLEAYINTYGNGKHSFIIKIDFSRGHNFIEFIFLGNKSNWSLLNKLYIHKDLINTSNYLFMVENCGLIIVQIYSLSLKYSDDYLTSVIEENRINEFKNLNSINLIFKDIRSIPYGNDKKYLYRYDIRGYNNI